MGLEGVRYGSSDISGKQEKNEQKNPFLSQFGSDSSLVRVDPVDSIIERFPKAKRPAFDDQHNVDERCQKDPYNSNNERNQGPDSLTATFSAATKNGKSAQRDQKPNCSK